MAIAKRTTTKKTVSKSRKATIHKHLEDQPLDLLSPQEFQAITAANYDHPESRIILRLFLHVNYFWHVSRHMQGPRSGISSIDWNCIEENAAQTIRDTFEKLLPGVETSAWDGKIPEKYRKA